MAERWQRNPSISETTVDDETFLVEPGDEDFHQRCRPPQEQLGVARRQP